MGLKHGMYRNHRTVPLYVYVFQGVIAMLGLVLAPVFGPVVGEITARQPENYGAMDHIKPQATCDTTDLSKQQNSADSALMLTVQMAPHGDNRGEHKQQPWILRSFKLVADSLIGHFILFSNWRFLLTAFSGKILQRLSKYISLNSMNSNLVSTFVNTLR